MTPKTPGRRLTLTAAFAVLVLAGTGPLAAQAPFLVKDIHPSAASDPNQLVTIGGTVYFVADDGASGLEVWKSDSTESGTVLVADVCPGACSSSPTELTAVGQTLYFVADDGSNGREIWKSDGAGASLVKDIRPGSYGSEAAELVEYDGQLFFRAFEGVNGVELWKSDGTPGGTVMVHDIYPGVTPSYPADLTVAGTTLFFSAGSGIGRELWKSDGNSAYLVKDINPGLGTSSPDELTAVGDTLFLTAWGAKGRELWKSDGNSAYLVKDIVYGFGGSYPTHLTDGGGSMLYFVADDGVSGAELWKSDGSQAGTVLVKDILPGSTTSGASRLVYVDGTLFLTADDGLVGEELWKSDGTTAGTEIVLDINTGPLGSSPCELKAVNAGVYFSADDGIAGAELWASDGSQAGTNLVADLVLGPPGSSPAEPAAASTMFYFAADEAIAGRELWALQVGAASLSLGNQFAEESAVIGSTGNVFTLTVWSTGTATSEDVRVTALVDSRLTVTQVTPSGDCFASSGQSVDCTFTALEPAASEVITVTFEVDGAVQPVADVPNLAEADAQNAALVQAVDHVDLLAPCQSMPVDAYLSNETVSTAGYLAEACNTITATDFVVTATGDATLRAGGSIVIENDFEVARGGSFEASIDPLQSTQ